MSKVQQLLDKPLIFTVFTSVWLSHNKKHKALDSLQQKEKHKKYKTGLTCMTEPTTSPPGK